MNDVQEHAAALIKIAIGVTMFSTLLFIFYGVVAW